LKTSIPLISPTRTERTIRASEVAQYVFCRRAWWLAAVQELPSANVQDLLAGERGHARHGRRVSLIRAADTLAYLVLLLAIVVGAIWVWISLAVP
jgi:hypothetical protein